MLIVDRRSISIFFSTVFKFSLEMFGIICRDLLDDSCRMVKYKQNSSDDILVSKFNFHLSIHSYTLHEMQITEWSTKFCDF